LFNLDYPDVDRILVSAKMPKTNVLQIYDVVRYRLHCMKKKLKDELENENTVQEYICPDCGKRSQ